MDREIMSGEHHALRHRIILKAFARIGLDKDVSEERIKAADYIIEKTGSQNGGISGEDTD